MRLDMGTGKKRQTPAKRRTLTKKKAGPMIKARKADAKANGSNGKYEYPPFGEKSFWDWHRMAAANNARKKQIGDDVRDFIAAIVEKYREDGYDPRRDISWYLEQLGNDLRGDVEREIADARRAAITAQSDTASK